MTVRAKLFAALWGLGVSIALLAGFAFWSMSTSEAAIDTIVQDRVAPMRDLKIVADRYAVDIVNASHKARNGNMSFEEAAEKVRKGSEALHESWRAYTLTKVVPEEEVLARVAEARMRAADDRVDELQSILDHGDRPALDRFVRTRLYQTIDPVSAAIAKLVDVQLKVATQAGNDASATAHLSGLLMTALIVAAVGVLAASLYIISGQVVAPIRRLANTLPSLATQQGAVTMPHLDQQDEIGEIARAVDEFRCAVIETEQQKTLVVARVTEVLASGLAALAHGDLTSQIVDDFPDAYAKVRADFNKAAAALHDTLAQVAAAAAGIDSGTGDIWQASDDLSRRTEQQAASLEQTAAAMDEITATVRSTAGHAFSANAAVRDAAVEAERSGAIVRRAMEAMGGIERSSSEISEIISVIDGIAFQTNLLALNAGVEAARAGDAGRGFAVVASEVRALAQRSADAAKDVKTRITASSAQVSAGVELVDEAGRALDRIIRKITEVNELIATIASSAEQQSTGLQQINVAVAEMDGVTQQNAAMVEQATAAARSLAGEVDEMMQQIARFRLHVAPSVHRAPPHNRQQRVVTAPVQAGRGAASSTSLSLRLRSRVTDGVRLAQPPLSPATDVESDVNPRWRTIPEPPALPRPSGARTGRRNRLTAPRSRGA
ncbi:methyl-accepting chemotaxis protein [Sphingomonas sp. 8AM]|uniref:methyl-accepting chemotaxis protein n=1 Tax=Sphingomonas sp. 8AM TaxID=2653170 RepID=UPI0012F04B22|nr:methyl-accepting chemotaxis protein [Sphingomonas sp. 8AM]VXD02118.1 Signal protein [Sphingomonas sp. 8AM]